MRDALSNITSPAAAQSTYTLASPPVNINSFKVYKTSITIQWLRNNNPNNTNFTGQISVESNFSPVFESRRS